MKRRLVAFVTVPFWVIYTLLLDATLYCCTGVKALWSTPHLVVSPLAEAIRPHYIEGVHDVSLRGESHSRGIMVSMFRVSSLLDVILPRRESGAKVS